MNNSVRLACVKHAASVHPEPGSNSRIWVSKDCDTFLFLTRRHARMGGCVRIKMCMQLEFSEWTCSRACIPISQSYFQSQSKSTWLILTVLSLLFWFVSFETFWNFLLEFFRVALLFSFQGCYGFEDYQRRRRDLNPRAAINDLLPFQGSPFSLLGTSP